MLSHSRLTPLIGSISHPVDTVKSCRFLDSNEYCTKICTTGTGSDYYTGFQSSPVRSGCIGADPCIGCLLIVGPWPYNLTTCRYLLSQCKLISSTSTIGSIIIITKSDMVSTSRKCCTGIVVIECFSIIILQIVQ